MLLLIKVSKEAGRVNLSFHYTQEKAGIQKLWLLQQQWIVVSLFRVLCVESNDPFFGDQGLIWVHRRQWLACPERCIFQIRVLSESAVYEPRAYFLS